MTSDVRSHYMRRLKSYGVVSTMTLLYPRILAVHDLTDDVGFPAGSMGRLKLPSPMRASYGWMVADGAYLMSKLKTLQFRALARTLADISSQWRDSDDLAWRSSVATDNRRSLGCRELRRTRCQNGKLISLSGRITLTTQTRLPKLPTLLSTQIRNILAHLEQIMAHPLPLSIIRQNMDGMEIEYANHLVEDSNNDALNYLDCEMPSAAARGPMADHLDLMTSHNAITNELFGGGGTKMIGEGWRPW